MHACLKLPVPAVWLGILVMLGYLVLFQLCALFFLTYLDGGCTAWPGSPRHATLLQLWGP